MNDASVVDVTGSLAPARPSRPLGPSTWEGWWSTLLHLSRAMLVPALLLAVAAPGPVVARTPLAEWQPTGLVDGAVVFLQAPDSGAFFARVQRGEGQATTSHDLRSDDGGQSWRPVEVPQDLVGFRVSPTDHTVQYAESREGLHKSVDDGATWQQILTSRASSSTSFNGINTVALSRADPQLIYVLTQSIPYSLGVRRSRDGGATWESAFSASGASPSCYFLVQAFLTHSTDPARALLVTSCRHYSDPADLDFSEPVRQSSDQGTTWQTVGAFPAGHIQQLVGWRGPKPERLYVTILRRGGTQGSSLYRSDDDGHTWTEILTLRDENAPEHTRGIDALAYDPAQPDRVFVAIGGGVRMSPDAGATWTDLGRQDLPNVRTLMGGVDGRNLYAGTDRGLYRFPLADE